MDHSSQVEEPSVELSKIIAASPDGAQLLQNPYDNPICRLSYNKDVKCIEVVWRRYATSPQLRYIHEIILCMLVKYNVSKILGDDSDLPIIHAEDQRWIAEQWLPRARAAGLKAAASVISMTFFGRVAIGSIQSALARKVQIRNFRNIHSARSWLKDLVPDGSPGR
jgi:hypothetical protein